MDVSTLRGLELFTGLSDEQLGELLAASDEVPIVPGSDCSERASMPISGGCSSRGPSSWCGTWAARI